MLEAVTFFKDYIIGFLVLISVLVFVHEMGHYLFAKLFKVKVEAFSIGFGKEIFGWTDKSGTRWKICPIPFGGYVKMKGEMLEKNFYDEVNEPNSFQAQSLLKKFLIVFAGPLFNLVFPIIILVFISFFAGVTTFKPKIGNVVENSPAHNILKTNDVVLKVQGIKITNFKELQEIILSLPNTLIDLEIARDGQILNLQVKSSVKELSGYQVGFLGVSVAEDSVSVSKYSIFDSVSYSMQTYMKVIFLMIDGFGKLFSGNISKDDIGGPIKIAQISGETLKEGVSSWLFFMAMLSINLAIINLFPLPALDGGFLLLYIIQGITRKKLSLKVQSILMQFGFVFLISLMVLVLLKDIFSFL